MQSEPNGKHCDTEALADADLDSEDDMASVVDGELERRENETGAQHKKRMAKLIRERAARRKEEKQRKQLAGKKPGKEGKERPSQKKK